LRCLTARVDHSEVLAGWEEGMRLAHSNGNRRAAVRMQTTSGAAHTGAETRQGGKGVVIGVEEMLHGEGG